MPAPRTKEKKTMTSPWTQQVPQPQSKQPDVASGIIKALLVLALAALAIWLAYWQGSKLGIW